MPPRRHAADINDADRGQQDGTEGDAEKNGAAVEPSSVAASLCEAFRPATPLSRRPQGDGYRNQLPFSLRATIKH
jgi:hypothetical protein